MVAVGMLLVWAGYGLGLEGWALWRDYDVTLGQLLSPLHPYAGPWPPARIPAGQMWPGGTPAATGTAGQGGQAPAPAKVAGAAAGSAGIIQKITQYLPGLGFIK